MFTLAYYLILGSFFTSLTMHYCCVPGCYNNSSTKDVSLHKFPWDTAQKRRWVTAINRKGDKPHTLFTPTLNHRVCSVHFVDGKKTPGSIPSVKTHHLAEATPSRKSRSSMKAAKPLSPRKLSQREKNQKIVQRLYAIGIAMPEVAAHEEVLSSNSQTELNNKYEYVVTPDHTYSSLSIAIVSPTKGNLTKKVNSSRSAVLQLMGSVSKAKSETKLLQSRVTDIDQIITDKDLLNFYTGFRGSSQFKSLMKFLEPDTHDLVYPSQGIAKFRNRLSNENSLLMTLMKYKLASQQEDLAFR